MLHGHAGEDTVKKRDETTADSAMNKINGRLLAHRIDDVGTDIDLIKGDARCRDRCGAARLSPENDETYKRVLTVDQGGLQTGRQEGLHSNRGN